MEKVAVLVLNFNGQHFLKGCLSSLMRQTYPAYHVIMIDNNSTDGSIEFVQGQFPEVGLMKNDRNLLFAGGNNSGLAKVIQDYPFVVLLNNDTEVAATWLEELVRPTSDAGVGIVTSTIVQKSQRYYGWFMNFYTGSVLGARTLPPGHTVFPVFYASGCSMLLKSVLLKQIGLLDEDYGAYFEDVDLSWRAWLAGYKVVCASESLVEHYGGGTSQHAPITLEWAERNRVLSYYKNLEEKSLMRIFPVMLLSRLSRWVMLRCNPFFLRGLYTGLRWLPFFRVKRAQVQQLRQIPDEQLFSLNENTGLTQLLKSAR
jgi:GT2 family glycosyltransferase